MYLNIKKLCCISFILLMSFGITTQETVWKIDSSPSKISLGITYFKVGTNYKPAKFALSNEVKIATEIHLIKQ